MIADDLSRIAMSTTLGDALARAMELARSQGHLEVALEHMLLSLCEDPDAGLVLAASNVDVNRLRADASIFLAGLQRQPSPPSDPAVSADLRRILEAAAAAARGGRRREINGAIVLAAIVGDGRSPAAQMLQSQGLTFEGAIRALQRGTGAPRPAPTSTEDILASARERVQSRTIGGLRKPEPPPIEEEEDLAPEAAEDEAAPEYDVPPTRSPGPVQAAQDYDDVPPTRPAGAPPSAPSYEDVPPTRSPGAPRGAPSYDDVPPTRPRPATAAPDHGDVPPTRPPAAPPPGMPNYDDVPPTAGRAPLPEREPAPPDFSVVPQPMRAPPPPAVGAPGGRTAPPKQAVPPPAPGAGMSGGMGRGVGPAMGAPQMPPPPQSDAARLPPSPPAPPPIPRPGAAPPWMPPQNARGPDAVPRTAPPALPPLGEGRARAGGAPAVPPQGAPGAPGRTILARAAGPTQAGAPDIRRVNRQAPRVEIGQLVENIPRTMRVAVPALVEVRIARNDVQALAEGLQGGGAAYRHEVTVTKAMSVRLRAPDGGFYIETASPETQWIEKTALVASEDFASWRWHVTPREKGKKRLQLIISARTVSADGLAAETALPDQVITVRVRTNYGKTISHLLGWSVAAVIGGLVARFGEGMLDTGMQIITRLMKS